MTECANAELVARLSFVTNVQKAFFRSCTIFYSTSDNTATGLTTIVLAILTLLPPTYLSTAGEDYMQQSGSCLFTSTVTTCDDIIFTIMDDFNNEMEETFNILLTSSDPDVCQVVNNNVTVTIMDDGKIRQ